MEISASRSIAADLAFLAFLHDREPDAETLKRLAACPLAEWLGLRLISDPAKQALSLLDGALSRVPSDPDSQLLDDLAADYANIYLTYAYRASPNESVWVDEDGLERQASMFAVRKWYEHYNLGAEDWRERADDHLVLQLQFLSFLFGAQKLDHSLSDAARFMDAHLLLWIHDFAERVSNRAETPFYAGLALLTAAYVEELRDYLNSATGVGRPVPNEDKRHRGPAWREDAALG